MFRIRMGDEWTINRVLTVDEHVSEEREADPTYTGLEEMHVPALQQVKVIDLGT